MNRRLFITLVLSFICLNIFSQENVRYANTQCGVSINKEVSKKFTKAANKNDIDTINWLIANQYVLVIEKGTKVKVISFGFAESQILILNGRHKGKTGYLENEFLSKN